MLQISVEKFKSSALEQILVHLSEAVCPQNTDFSFPDPVHLDGILYKRGQNLQFVGESDVSVYLVCDRCGKSFPYPIQVHLDEYYSQQAQTPDQAGERDIHSFSGNWIDLTPEFLQAVFLALPMKRLCKNDCKGICAGCGINLNNAVCSCGEKPIDPRLEKLKDYVFDDSQKGV